jgi:hypothetical protein
VKEVSEVVALRDFPTKDESAKSDRRVSIIFSAPSEAHSS